MAFIDEVLLQDLVYTDDFKANASGDLDVIKGLANLKAALYRRLITNPGGLVHRPNYGVGIKRWMNSVNSIANQQSLATTIQEQFLQENGVSELTSIRIETDDEIPGQVRIITRVDVEGYGEVTLDFVPFGEVV